MAALLQSLQDFFKAHTFDRTYWIAYSGGLDSHVLLHLCAQLSNSLPLSIRAIHINHQLSPHAAQWVTYTEQVCQQLYLPYISHAIALQPSSGMSLEALAREKRYAAFAHYLQPGDILLTAHQQDDQAETLLLQLLRGAGPKGLAAMPSMKPFAQGWHARPLLAFSRAELRQYAEEAQLHWIEDESNDDIALSRNYIRHEVMPVLKLHWSAVTSMLSRVATHCAEAQAVLEEIGTEDLIQLAGSMPHTLSVQRLLKLNPMRQRLALRAWLQQQGKTLPSQVKMQALQQDVLTAKWDSMPVLHWGNVELRRYRDDLYVMSCMLPVKNEHYTWDCQQPLSLPNIGALIARKVTGQEGLCLPSTMSVRFRQGGEQVFVRGHYHDLKKMFQEWGVPPWQRARLPLVCVENEIVTIPGFFIHQAYQAQHGESSVIIKFVAE
ncbi:MAG: tRNA lysidine(34) synthetase TilS [Gammaproteobacteria bacterium RIFCSPHIGHO2_12_FULL_41_20]|nr:MAG: tRNA lysidine(34) synthetase TilS [Gammaproteobacteria bacterium RIFCSPHIGHO2_12_FULL_41_20]